MGRKGWVKPLYILSPISWVPANIFFKRSFKPSKHWQEINTLLKRILYVIAEESILYTFRWVSPSPEFQGLNWECYIQNTMPATLTFNRMDRITMCGLSQVGSREEDHSIWSSDWKRGGLLSVGHASDNFWRVCWNLTRAIIPQIWASVFWSIMKSLVKKIYQKNLVLVSEMSLLLVSVL